MINKMSMVLTIVMLAILDINGQGRQQKREYSEKENEAIYKKNLQLDKLPKEAVEIEFKYSIPLDEEIKKNDIFFRSIQMFNIDNRGHIFMADHGLSTIYEFENTGKLLKKVHKYGQGPGEFTSPIMVLSFDKNYIVEDGGTGRLIFYNQEWKYVRNISLFKTYCHLAVGMNGIIYGVNTSHNKLIDVLNINGEIITSFGEMSYKIGSVLNRAKVTVSPSGNIWSAMQAIGVIRKYDNSGKMTREINVIKDASRKLKNDLKQNIEWEKQGLHQFIPILKNISVIDDDIIVMVGGTIQPIFRYDQIGKIKNVYFVKPKDHYVQFYECKTFRDKDGEEKFFILEFDDYDVRIGVYGRKNSGNLKGGYE